MSTVDDTIDAAGLAKDIGGRFLSKIAPGDGRYSAERMAVALAAIKDCLTDAEESVSGSEDYQKWQVKKEKECLESYFSQDVWSAESHEGETSEEVLLLNIEVLQRSTNKVKGALFKRMETGGQVVFGQWFNYALYRLLQLSHEQIPVGSMNDITAIKMLKSLFTFIKDNLKGLKREKLRDQFGVSLVDSIKLARRVIDAASSTTKPLGLDEECSLVEIHVGLSTATAGTATAQTLVPNPATDATLQEKQKDDDARQNRINAMRFRRASSKSFTVSAADATASTSAAVVSAPVESLSYKSTTTMNPKPSDVTKPQSLAASSSIRPSEATKPQSHATATSKPRLEETSQPLEKKRKVVECTTDVPAASNRQAAGEQIVAMTTSSSPTPPAKTHQTEPFQMQQSQSDATTRQETAQLHRGYADDTSQAQPPQQRGYSDVQAVTQQRGYADVPQIQQRGYTDARAEPRGYVDVPPVQQRGYADAPAPMSKYSDLPGQASGGADEFPVEGRDRDRGYARKNSRDSNSQGRSNRNRRGGRRNRGRAGEQQGESSRPKKRARRSAQEPAPAAVGAGARGRGRGRDVNKPAWMTAQERAGKSETLPAEVLPSQSLTNGRGGQEQDMSADRPGLASGNAGRGQGLGRGGVSNKPAWMTAREREATGGTSITSAASTSRPVGRGRGVSNLPAWMAKGTPAAAPSATNSGRAFGAGNSAIAGRGRGVGRGARGRGVSNLPAWMTEK